MLTFVGWTMFIVVPLSALRKESILPYFSFSSTHFWMKAVKTSLALRR